MLSARNGARSAIEQNTNEQEPESRWLAAALAPTGTLISFMPLNRIAQHSLLWRLSNSLESARSRSRSVQFDNFLCSAGAVRRRHGRRSGRTWALSAVCCLLCAVWTEIDPSVRLHQIKSRIESTRAEPINQSVSLESTPTAPREASERPSGAAC